MKKLFSTLIFLLLPTLALADAQVAVGAQPTLYFRQVASSDHLTAVTGATIAAAECRYIINGGSINNCGGTWAEEEQGVYSYTPTTTETGAAGFVAYLVKDSTADLAVREVQVGLPYNIVNPRGTLQSATATTAVLAAAESAADDRYNDTHKLVILSGTGAGQSRCITDYVNSSDTATVATWGTTPDNTSTYDILPDAACSANVERWKGVALATPDTTGYPKVTVKDGTGTGEIDTSSGSVASVTAVGSVTGAVGSVTGNVGGSVASVTALANDAIGEPDISDAAAEKIADIILRRTTTNVEGSSNGDAVSRKSLYGAIARLTHKVKNEAGSLKSYKADGTTLLDSQAITTDPSAQPITEMGN